MEVIEIMQTMMAWGMPEQQGWRKGPWTPEEDKLLSDYVSLHGEGRWSSVARSAGKYIYIYPTIVIYAISQEKKKTSNSLNFSS